MNTYKDEQIKVCAIYKIKSLTITDHSNMLNLRLSSFQTPLLKCHSVVTSVKIFVLCVL